MKSKTLIILIVFSLYPLKAKCQTESETLRWLQKYEHAKDVGFAVGVINGNNVEKTFHGYADAQQKVLIDSLTTFKIASVTTAFTGTLLGYMINNGSLSLSKPISNYTTFSSTSNIGQLSLLELSTGKSGLPDLVTIRKEIGFNITENNILEAVNNNTKTNKKKAIEYTDTNAALIGGIISKITSVSYANLLKDSICIPLSIKSPIDKDKRIATGHSKKNKVVEKGDFDSLFSTYGIALNLEQMLLFLQAQITPPYGKIGKAIQTSQELYHFSDLGGHGLFWTMATIDQRAGYSGPPIHQYYIHGSYAGFSSFIGLMPDLQTGVVILTNKEVNLVLVGLTLLSNQVSK